ncbi:AAA family ATPase [Lentisphaerota bacterium WC36G]|nr:AAA family ATPase [Lentisphaerae bacterium WC36]
MLQINRGKIQKAQRVIVYGPEGIGKTSIASKFPNPVFIDTEGGSYHLDVARTPSPDSWEMLKHILGELIIDNQGFQTVVIDTADWAERLCIQHICAVGDEKGPNKTGLENFGFGKGYVYLEEEFGRLLDTLSRLIDKNVNVVLLAHSHLSRFEQPDEIGAYDRYELKMTKKTRPLIKEWADMVLFCNYKTFVQEIDGKKKASGGQRVMYSSHCPSWDAKNRHNLPYEMPLDYSQIAHTIPVFDNNPQQQPKVADTAPTAEQAMQEATVEDELNAATPPDDFKGQSQVENKNYPQLYSLMEANGITEQEIKEVVANFGIYPIDTPIEQYDENLVNGRLIPKFEAVKDAIINNRNK